MGRVSPIDPDASRSRVYRAAEAFAQTAAGRWMAIHVAPRIDPIILRLTGGRTGSFPQGKVVLLTCPGRRTGTPRATPLLYFTEGEDVILIASSYGRETHPAWYRNAVAAEEVDLRAGPAGGPYRVTDVTDPGERQRLYDRANGIFSGGPDDPGAAAHAAVPPLTDDALRTART
jgi:deazaflavin-dependent oxidoreductase (nitroreductase family)